LKTFRRERIVEPAHVVAQQIDPRSGSTRPRIGRKSAHWSHHATVNPFRRCLKVIDTFRCMDNNSAGTKMAAASLRDAVSKENRRGRLTAYGWNCSWIAL
jgi:hypothetical protein